MNVSPRVPRRIPVEFWRLPGVRLALATHDIAALFRLLRRHTGMSQREIAVLTGQSQSEISEILAGRSVQSYDVLARIAAGLRVPRSWLGLGYDRVSARLLRGVRRPT